jgi:uncharacterized protein (TIGR02679 family)
VSAGGDPEEPAAAADPDLHRFLARPGFRRFWPAVRERVEALGGARGTVHLPDATGEERRAVADLLGLATLPRGELRVRLDRLDRALCASRFAVDLPAALAALGGPLRDRPGERIAAARRAEKLWDEAAAHPLLALQPELTGWLADLRATGLVRRLAGGLIGGGVGDGTGGGTGGGERRLLAQAFAVLAALAQGKDGERLPVLASRVLGGSHALDPGSPAATLVLRALARRAGQPPPATARERRALWEGAGVVTDDLSCAVLTVGLAPAGGGAIGESLRALAAAGEPAWITLRQLAAAGLAFGAGRQVRVCENPVVVAAAADRYGPASPPLVCLGGFPNHAARTLLRHFSARGAEVHYHGDFDWAGLRIANSLAETVPFRPWRFTAAAYRAALRSTVDPQPLRGNPAAATWDPDLGPALAEAGVAVEEEAVLEELLADLAG